MRKSQSSTNKHEFNELSESITDGIIPLSRAISNEDFIYNNFDLVHVNFGAGGSYDGYFHYDAFNLSEDEYHKYAEENDIPQTSSNLVYDLDVYYLIYDI